MLNLRFVTAHTQKIGEYLVPPRVVVFTDGRFTNFAKNGAKEDEAERQPSDSVCVYTHWQAGFIRK